MNKICSIENVMDNGCYYGMLVDVVVSQSRQQSGLGREMVTRLHELTVFRSALFRSVLRHTLQTHVARLMVA